MGQLSLWNRKTLAQYEYKDNMNMNVYKYHIYVCMYICISFLCIYINHCYDVMSFVLIVSLLNKVGLHLPVICKS